jgi:hypothetical protein
MNIFLLSTNAFVLPTALSAQLRNLGVLGRVDLHMENVHRGHDHGEFDPGLLISPNTNL